MKEGWKYERLLDKCDVYQPKTISSKQLIEDGEYDVFGANGWIGKYNQYNHEQSEVLLTCRGATCGNINVSTPKAWINGNAMVVHPKGNDILKDYLVYLLKAIDFSQVITGAAQPQITRTSLAAIRIPILTISDQQRIVSYLDSEFANIEALKANAEKQLQAAKDLFQAALKESLTPKEGWVNGILSDIAIIMHGKNQKDVQNELGQYPIYGSGGTIMGYADDYLCEAGTTILGRKGTINNPQYIGTRFWNVDTAFGISAKYDNDNKFLFYLIKLEDWTKRNTGTTLPSLTQTVIANVPISFPLKGEQQRIADRLDALSANVKALQTNYTETITLCNDLKQALLKKVFG